jgi:transketolase
MSVYRPADANETSASYAMALQNSHSPAIFALGRTPVPNLLGSSFENAQKGAYFIFDSSDASGGATPAAAGAPDLVVAATGTEVCIAIEGAKQLAASSGKRVAVASMPCLEVFEAQPLAYRTSILPPGVPVVSIEASSVRGWERYAHASVGLTTFGVSAPANDAYKALGITAEAVASKGAALLAHFGSSAPVLPVNSPVF